MTDKRDAILAATLNLISENGFHGTPMSKVAKEAGVSAGIIYHYFENKDDLIDELFKAVKQNFGEALLVGYDDTLPIREQFRRMMQNAFHYYIHHPQETVFMEQYARSPYYCLEIESEVAQYYLPLFQMIERSQQEQIVKDFPAPVLYSLTLEVASSLAQKHAAGEIQLTEALIEQVIDACWNAARR